VINELPIESYLESVAFSEATTGASDEYLKAQTVAARSTVLATVSRHHRADPFDLCADDHCQCYYGIDQVDNRVSNLVNATRGLVRVSGQRPADCRYAKICGGVSEN
jgi:SpoIID/LytB domain protein